MNKVTRRTLIGFGAALPALMAVFGPFRKATAMLITNIYSPDTCLCELEYTWDDQVPENKRLYTMTALRNRCTYHAAVLDASLLSVINEEVQRKNGALALSASSVAVASQDDIEWTYTPGRLLELRFPTVNLSAKQKSTLQGQLDTEYGLGKIKVY